MREKETNVAQMPVSLSAGALEEIRRIQEGGSYPIDAALRIGVKGGGCAGFSYILEFEIPTDKDHIYDVEGIRVAIDPAHEIYLYGVKIDFKKGLDNRGFIFDNPNAEETCGCGTSFSA